LGAQPRRLPPLIKNFREVLSLQVSETELKVLSTLKPGKSAEFRGKAYPNGLKLLSVSNKDGEGDGLSTADIGICWAEQEFVACAKLLQHPIDKVPELSPNACKVLHTIATLGPRAVARLRESQLEKYTSMKTQLEDQEKSLHASLHPDVERVVGGKNILLFKRMLLDVGYDDVSVVDLLVVGVKLIGELEDLPFWELEPAKSALLSMEALLSGAKAAQVKSAAVDQSWSKEEQEIWQGTLEEVETNLLAGPWSTEELKSKLGPLWIAARRFPIVQGEKVRPIDDFSEFGVNQAFGARHKLKMNSVEAVVAIARAWVECVNPDRSFALKDNEGGCWQGMLHEEWTIEGWRSIQGRLTDLKSAYKQLAAHPASSFVNVWL
jgi:hypothetical protein